MAEGDNNFNSVGTGYNQGIYIYAARYAHNRDTGAALQVVNSIRRVWNQLDSHIKDQLKRESLEATYNIEEWEFLRDLPDD